MRSEGTIVWQRISALLLHPTILCHWTGKIISTILPKKSCLSYIPVLVLESSLYVRPCFQYLHQIMCAAIPRRILLYFVSQEVHWFNTRREKDYYYRFRVFSACFVRPEPPASNNLIRDVLYSNEHYHSSLVVISLRNSLPFYSSSDFATPPGTQANLPKGILALTYQARGTSGASKPGLDSRSSHLVLLWISRKLLLLREGDCRGGLVVELEICQKTHSLAPLMLKSVHSFVQAATSTGSSYSYSARRPSSQPPVSD